MTGVFKAAAQLQAVCDQQEWSYCFIRGLALQRWGEPRMTKDADLTLITGFGREEGFIETLLRHFQGRIDDAREFALRNRVLLLRAESGVGLDVALGALPFEERAVERSSMFVYPDNIPLRTCSAEDLIVFKAFADRGQDWVDIERVLIRQQRSLDWPYILHQLGPLVAAKEAPEILTKLERLRASSR
ncbi:MAG: hypothetical protein RIS76_1510 [Verrucomicrobiota bacterium]|jgi:hypothetical protein